MSLPPIRIPFNKASFEVNEPVYAQAAMSGGHASGCGPFTGRCETRLRELLSSGRVLLTTSCTHALEMAALLLDIGPGDQVIVPSFTFVSTANAFVLRGATPVFADILPDTLNLDHEKLPGLITPRTRAIVPVHYAGVGCEMDAIMALAAEHGLSVVEDNAHGMFGRYRDRPLGSIGRLATQSFHETKNISCGEGGALVINDAELVERAEILREKGTDRSRFFRGQVDKYTWVDLGSSYVLSDILAAVLWGQLERVEEIQGKRKRIWNRYRDAFGEWAECSGVRLPFVPEHCEQAYHMFYLIMPTTDARDRLIARLRQSGILAVFHYLPLHLSPMGRRYGGLPGQCPVAEDISSRLVRLPLYTSLGEQDHQRVIEEVLKASSQEW